MIFARLPAVISGDIRSSRGLRALGDWVPGFGEDV
jgi:hypothetical protein